ncbi:hypothetical protein EDD16DRAFT_1525348 [Pisolithus croceorrhizus]|nr:hypothetical protein EDD16DRAFT_1525348 [Pisolithus croceorrhizus]
MCELARVGNGRVESVWPGPRKMAGSCGRSSGGSFLEKEEKDKWALRSCATNALLSKYVLTVRHGARDEETMDVPRNIIINRPDSQPAGSGFAGNTPPEVQNHVWISRRKISPTEGKLEIAKLTRTPPHLQRHGDLAPRTFKEHPTFVASHRAESGRLPACIWYYATGPRFPLILLTSLSTSMAITTGVWAVGAPQDKERKGNTRGAGLSKD